MTLLWLNFPAPVEMNATLQILNKKGGCYIRKGNYRAETVYKAIEMTWAPILVTGMLRLL